MTTHHDPRTINLVADFLAREFGEDGFLPLSKRDGAAVRLLDELDAALPPMLTLAPDSEITPEQAEAWQRQWDELFGADGADHRQPPARSPRTPPTRAYEDLLGDISLYVDWRFLTKQLTTEQKILWADAHDAWAARMGHDEPSKAERWWSE